MGQITNKDVKQYEKLVYKIAHQLAPKSPLPFDDVVQYGYEGLLEAFEIYDETKSKQTFLQFAAYRIRFFIMNMSVREGYICRMNDYALSKTGAFTVDCNKSKVCQELIDEPVESVDSKDIMSKLSRFIESNFKRNEYEIFYKFFGICGYKQTKGVDIALEYGISSTRISLNNKKIISKIKTNNLLIEQLSKLL